MATYYVATTGTNGPPPTRGTRSQPFATLNYAVAFLAPGDTLYVRAGYYDESLINNIPSGISWRFPIRIAAYAGETVWVRPTNPALTQAVNFGGAQQYIELDGINVDGGAVHDDAIKLNGTTDADMAHHIRIKNAEVIGPSRVDPVFLDGPQAILVVQMAANTGNPGANEFVNLKVHRVQGAGFYLQSDDNVVDHCEVYACATGVELNNSYPGMSSDHQTVKNCRIHDMVPDAIDGRARGIVAIGAGNVFFNNVIYSITGTSSTTAGIHLYYGSGAQVYNNTIYGVNYYGILIEVTSGSSVQNNISLGNGTNYSDSGSGTTADHNSWNLFPSASPTDVWNNPASGDFYLKTGSPAINAGVDVSFVTTDMLGIPRATSGNDLGAHERPTSPTYYVSTAGSDAVTKATAANPYTPWRTLGHATALLVAGDTLIVRNGVYVEALGTAEGNAIGSGTSWSNMVRIKACVGERMWLSPPTGTEGIAIHLANNIDKSYIEFDGINIDAQNCVGFAMKLECAVSGGEAHHIRYMNADIVLGPAYVAFLNSGDRVNAQGRNQILYNRIYGNEPNGSDPGHMDALPNEAFYIGTSYNLIMGNDVSDMLGGGGQVYNGYAGCVAVGNVFCDNYWHDIVSPQVYDTGARIYALVLYGYNVTDTYVFNNVIANVGTGGTYHYGIGAGSGAPRTYIWNNTAYHVRGKGFDPNSDGTVTAAQFKNNIAYLCDTNVGSLTNVDAQTNLTDGTNPLFVDAAHGNFRLQEGSPAIDIGTTIAVTAYNQGTMTITTSVDADGVPRPYGSAYDIGAYEWTTTEAGYTTYYVSPSGDDSYTGTSTNYPWKTLNRAVASLTPGDTLYVRAGTYEESLINNIPSGTSWVVPVRIAAFPGESPWMIPAAGADRILEFGGASVQRYIEIDGINLDGVNCNYDVVKYYGLSATQTCDHIRLKNCEVLGPLTETPGMGSSQPQIILSAAYPSDPMYAAFLEWRNLHIHRGHGISEFGPHGIYINGADSIVEYCTIHDVGGNGVQINNNNGGAANRCIIRNNTIYDIDAVQEEYLYGGARHSGIVFGNACDDCEVYNNVIYDVIAYDTGGYSGGIDVVYPARTKIYNNTVVHCTKGIRISSAAVDTDCRNNICYDNDADFFDEGTTTTHLTSIDDGTNPQFIDYLNRNLRLFASSPAIDAGGDVAIGGIDREGTVRSAGSYDIGAYEWYEGAVTNPVLVNRVNGGIA